MKQPPEPMTNRPSFNDLQETEDSQADVLSQVLQLIRLRGERVYRTEMGHPWRQQVAPGVSHVHFVESGQMRIEPVDAAPLIARAGDLILLPHGRGHTLADAGAGPPTRFIGGLFRYEALPLPPIIAALPSVVFIGGDGGAVPRWLEAMMQHLLLEATEPRPGSTLMISRMIDLLVIRTLRTWAERNPRPGASLRDDRIAKVLRSIHGEPEHAWTLDSLAQRAAMSRSAFAEHFTKLVGYSPLRYLTRWRLSLADELLRSGSVGVAEAAQRVGYSSEAGFSRAFKAHHGYAPNAAKPRSDVR
jgi:AraC-like DNA-binding protein